jgi:CHAT domain-containing protein
VPSFGSELDVINFPALPNTRIEGELIADLLGVYPLTGSKVTDSGIKTCTSPHVLHLATHGFFLSTPFEDPNNQVKNAETMGMFRSGIINLSSWKTLRNPLLRSGLALAGANTLAREGVLLKEFEDGILTAEDVTGMDLMNTELVVLSACDTGLGYVLNGEGVFGLRRSFVLAGARTLVMSLWKVPDKQTTELMVDFYSQMSNGQSRANALRKAQLRIKKQYPNPLYWGAFICQGNPGHLTIVPQNC